MTRLNELSLETIHLIAPDNDKAVYIGKMDAKNQIQLRSRIGWKIPLQCTSGGKLILAYHSREWVDSYLNYNPLKQYTNNTIIHKETLHRELELIRQSRDTRWITGSIIRTLSVLRHLYSELMGILPEQ